MNAGFAEGRGEHKGEGFMVSHTLSDCLFYSSVTSVPVMQKEPVLLLTEAVIKVL